MKAKLSVSILILGLLFASLIPPVTAESAEPILVYGREACGLCQTLRQNLETVQIAHTYYDIDTDQAKRSEMWRKINIAHPAYVGGVRLPVVDIDGKILISPSFETVKKYR